MTDRSKAGKWCKGCGSPVGPDDEEGPAITFPGQGTYHFQCWENHAWRPEQERLRAEAAREFESGNDWCARAVAAESVVAAIRDLCDERDSGVQQGRYVFPYLATFAIRAITDATEETK